MHGNLIVFAAMSPDATLMNGKDSIEKQILSNDGKVWVDVLDEPSLKRVRFCRLQMEAMV